MNDTVHTDAPAVRQIVRRVARPGNNPLAQARALFDWETAHIRYSSQVGEPSGAVVTLIRRRGNCSDFAALYAALLRTARIPACLISGYVANNGGGKAGFHQWDEFYLAGTGWVAADPTWGRFGYFASIPDDWHIALYAGSGPAVRVNYWSRNGDQTLRVHVRYTLLTQTIPTHMLSKRARPLLPVSAPLKPGMNAPLSWRVRLRAHLDRWWRRAIQTLAHLVPRV